MRMCTEYESFDEIASWLNNLEDQTVGDASAICEIGEPYIEFKCFGIARPGDEKIVERVVARDMSRKLSEYFSDKSGRIYWRVPLEVDVNPIEIVIRLDVNGPDIDFITNKRCISDKNWVRVACYCRLVKAKMRCIEPQEKAKAA